MAASSGPFFLIDGEESRSLFPAFPPGIDSLSSPVAPWLLPGDWTAAADDEEEEEDARYEYEMK